MKSVNPRINNIFSKKKNKHEIDLRKYEKVATATNKKKYFCFWKKPVKCYVTNKKCRKAE